MNVSKNASQTLKVPESVNKVKNTVARDKQIQSRSADRRNLLSNIAQSDDNTLTQCTQCDTMKFKTKFMSTTSKRITLQRPIVRVPTLKLTPAHSAASDKYVSTSLSTKVSSANTSGTRVQLQRQYDDIETTLAKITSSQRTICSVIDSLM